MAKTIEKREIEEFLRNIWAFKLLDPDQLLSLARLVVVRKFASNEILWLQGQSVTHFSIVFNGRLRCVRGSSGGSEKLLGTLNRGYHFGLAEMITGATSTVTLIADKPTIILAIDRNSLLKKLLSDNGICYRLMQTMARTIFDLTRELERASFENVHTRLARLLLKGHSHRSELNGSARPGRNISHEELSVQLGVSRETVSRVLSDFRKKGLIKTAYRQIQILDRDGLMEYIEDYDQW